MATEQKAKGAVQVAANPHGKSKGAVQVKYSAAAPSAPPAGTLAMMGVGT
jgi:hypothetical protein